MHWGSISQYSTNIPSTETEESETSAFFNTRGTQHIHQSEAMGPRKTLFWKKQNFFFFGMVHRLTASVKASLFCSSWASRSFCKKKQNVGYWQELNRWRGKLADEQRHGLPSTVCILESPRKRGTSPHIFQSRSVENRQCVKKNFNHVFLIPELNNKEKKSP